MTTPFAAACDAGPGLRTTPARHVSFAAPSLPEGQFAFARVKGNVCLVQLSYSTPAASSALAPLDVKIFRHEFITIFRFSHCDTVHPADISIIEPIDNHLARYEEENGTVFLAREPAEIDAKQSRYSEAAAVIDTVLCVTTMENTKLGSCGVYECVYTQVHTDSHTF